MSESLTINTLNRGHYTYTHRGQRLEWDQVMRIREGERLKKKLEKPQSRPHKAGGKGGARTLDLPPEQAQSVFHFSTPRRVGFDTQ